MNRRRLIIILFGYLAGFTLWRKSGLSYKDLHKHQFDLDDIGIDFSRLFSNLGYAKAVGKCYLEHYPEKSDRNTIIAELNLPAIDSKIHRRFSTRKWINESQQRDFSRGDTVTVNNWILSRTEANLCALIALA